MRKKTKGGHMTPQEERKDAFQTVGIEVRAKIEELCNKYKFEEAQALKDAYRTINQYCGNKLEQPKLPNPYVFRCNACQWLGKRKDSKCTTCVGGKNFKPRKGERG